MAGNPYRDELGRFAEGPGGAAKGLGGKALKSVKREFGASWKKMTPQAQQRHLRRAAKDLAPSSGQLKTKAMKSVKREFGASWEKMTPQAQRRHLSNRIKLFKNGE